MAQAASYLRGVMNRDTSPPIVKRRIVGRRECRFCGFEHAHVKRTGRAQRAYLYCPECGLTTHSHNGMQSELITKGMRPEPIACGEVLQPPPADVPIIVPHMLGPVAQPPAPSVFKPRAAGPWDQLLQHHQS